LATPAFRLPVFFWRKAMPLRIIACNNTPHASPRCAPGGLLFWASATRASPLKTQPRCKHLRVLAGFLCPPFGQPEPADDPVRQTGADHRSASRSAHPARHAHRRPGAGKTIPYPHQLLPLRAYWLPFEQAAASGDDHAFAAGADFATVLAIYDFDRELRLLLIDAIERVEISLRTRLANQPKRQKSATFSTRAVSVLCLACG
jgi:hypothetical protein